MYGAIIGDLAGSIYEYKEMLDSQQGVCNIKRRKEILTKDNLIDQKAFFSDDTILTMAILDSILNDIPYEKKLKEYGLKYKSSVPTKPYFEYMFSPNFIKWCENKQSGNSYGNGAAMRISPIGYMFNDINQIKNQVKLATIPSHNTKEAIEGAYKVALVIYLARCGYNMTEIKNFIQTKYGYSFNTHINDIRNHNNFNCSCEYSVELALIALFNSNNLEEAIRIAISFGGDTDTIACITGSMAEALYGVPNNLKQIVRQKLPKHFLNLLDISYSKIENLKKSS